RYPLATHGRTIHWGHSRQNRIVPNCRQCPQCPLRADLSDVGRSPAEQAIKFRRRERGGDSVSDARSGGRREAEFSAEPDHVSLCFVLACANKDAERNATRRDGKK